MPGHTRSSAVSRARLALIGGEEFSDGFEDVHAALLDAAGGAGSRVVYLPTCAADDGAEAIDYWCATAQQKLAALGASVLTPRVVDNASADDSSHAQLVAEADWIYLGGGYPHVAMRVLAATRVLEAVYAATRRGALVSGSSGGAMLMGARSFVMSPELIAEVERVWESGCPPDWDPPMPALLDCLGLAPGVICAPHFNRVFSHRWLERGLPPPGLVLVGIDEQTALVQRGGVWEVLGRGGVTLFRDGLKPSRHAPSGPVSL